MADFCVFCLYPVSHIRCYVLQVFETCTYLNFVDIFYVVILYLFRFKPCLGLAVD
jgi:hypothetical protein